MKCTSQTIYKSLLMKILLNSALVTCVLLICIEVNSLSTIPAFKPMTKYVEAGTLQINFIGSSTFSTAGIYGSFLQTLISSHTFTINLLATRSTLYSGFFSFEQLNYQINTKLINITLNRCGYTTTSMSCCVLSTNANMLQILVVRHMVLDRTFNNKFWLWVGQSYSPFTVSNVSSYSIPFSIAGNPMTTAGGTIVNIAILNGINMTCGSTANIFDIKLKSSGSSSQITVTISTTASPPMNIKSISVLMACYNTIDNAVWPFPAVSLEYQAFSASNNGIATFTDTSLAAYDINTFWGLSRFHMSGQTSFSFATSFTPQVSITGTSALPFLDYAFVGMAWIFKECDASTIYYLISNNTCYDICPQRYYESTVDYTCQICSQYYCWKCNSSTATASCTSCNATVDFRVLVAGVCQPLPGYYNSGTNSIAQPCSANCSTCITTSVQCVLCPAAFYLKSTTKVCLPCLANCISCTSSTTCSACAPGLTLLANSCYYNCPAILNCLTCSNMTGCSLCAVSYLLINPMTCQVPVCGNGLVEGSQVCDDHNLIDGDGCSSTCTVQLGSYCSGTNASICSTCMAYCSSCIDGISCTNCSYAIAPWDLTSLTCNPICTSLPGCLTCTLINSTDVHCLSCLSGYIYDNITSTCIPCSTLAPWDTPSSTCMPNCTLIWQCLSCSLISNTSLGCSSCMVGYSPNLSNSACIVICGDGAIGPGESCDDGNTIDGDGCSSICGIELGFFCTSVTSSICSTCMTYCSSCTNGSDCLNCSYAIAPWNSNSSSCFPICTSIPYCVTCTLLNSTDVECLTCLTGYTINYTNFGCENICGDGIIVSPESCDGGSMNVTGCFNCFILNGYYCSGLPSTCSQCLSYCQSCSDGISCNTCNSLTLWDSALFTCTPNCILVSLCLTCNMNASLSLICLTCVAGYSPSASSDSCLVICGDGQVGPNEDCDDGNLLNGDGCEEDCKIQVGYYCLGSPSTCATCMLYCNVCTNNTSCSACLPLTAWSNATNGCAINCTASVLECMGCTLTFNQITCTSCSYGFYISASNTCLSTCGDGIVTTSEACDDNNIKSGDGCSSACAVEDYFACSLNIANNMSECFLTTLMISPCIIVKNGELNQLTIEFNIFPDLKEFYSNMNWSQIIVSAVGLEGKLVNLQYNPSTGRLQLIAAYNSDIQNKDVDFNWNLASVSSLSRLSSNANTVKMNADNNQALVYYPEQTYALAKVIQYLSLIIGIAALLLMCIGFFGGKVICLEAAAVIQISYLSLLSLNKMSPIFSQLQKLAISCGYHSIQTYNMTQTINKEEKGIAFDVNLFKNYNIMLGMIIVPLLVAAICKILSKTCLKNKVTLLTAISNYCLAQYILYGFMFSAYIIYTSFFVSLKFINLQTTSALGVVGLISSCLFFVVGAIYVIFYYRAIAAFFGQFKSKFKKDFFGQKFYIFAMIERLLVSMVLVLTISLSFQNAFLIGIFGVEMIIVVTKKPYFGINNKNIRPALNLGITCLIEAIFLANKLLDDPKSIVSSYGPFLILGLLLAVVVYSSVALVSELKDSILKFKNFVSEHNSEHVKKDQADVEFKELKDLILNSQETSILKMVNSTFGDLTNKEITSHWENYDKPTFQPIQSFSPELIQRSKQLPIQTNAKTNRQIELEQIKHHIQKIATPNAKPIKIQPAQTILEENQFVVDE